jgi:hypothetical protein
MPRIIQEQRHAQMHPVFIASPSWPSSSSWLYVVSCSQVAIPALALSSKQCGCVLARQAQASCGVSVSGKLDTQKMPAEPFCSKQFIMACARISCSTFALALVNTIIPSSTIACTLEKEHFKPLLAGCTVFNRDLKSTFALHPKTTFLGLLFPFLHQICSPIICPVDSTLREMPSGMVSG